MQEVCGFLLIRLKMRKKSAVSRCPRSNQVPVHIRLALRLKNKMGVLTDREKVRFLVFVVRSLAREIAHDAQALFWNGRSSVVH